MKSTKWKELLLVVLTLFFLVGCQNKDLEAPVLNGINDVTYVIGDTVPDFTSIISALDNADTDINVTIDSSKVNFDVPGQYRVDVTAADSSGNKTESYFTVTVENEKVKPQITGTKNYTLEQGALKPNYMDEVLASDNRDGNITSQVIVNDSAVDYNKIGSYPVVYTVKDAALNETSVTITVQIVIETVLPELLGIEEIHIALNSTNSNYLANITANDNLDGDITDQIVVDSSLVDLTVLGSYKITYRVSDSSGNEKIVESIVHVKDMTAPVISGSRNLTFEVFSQPNFLWKEITVVDDIDGDLLSQIIIDDSAVDLAKLGTYPLDYIARDQSGNEAKVTVYITIADRTKPVFNVLKSTIYYAPGEDAPNYIENASANDNYDGDVSHKITFTTNVNYLVAGTYDVIYSVKDNQNNTQTLTIKVVVAKESDVLLVSQDYDALVLNTTNITQNSLILPKTGSQGSTISWKSLNPEIVSDLGNIARQNVGDGTTEVDMIATIINGTYRKEKTVTFLISDLSETQISRKTYFEYVGLGSDYVTTNSGLDLFFDYNVPYVDIEEFLLMIDGAIDSSILNFEYLGSLLNISYTVEYEDISGTMVIEDFEAVLDFDLNTLTVQTFSFFDNYVESTTTDYGDGLIYVGVDSLDPQQVIFTLGDYGFDMVIYQDGTDTEYLMPFHVANLIFLGNTYFDVYFNGDKLYGLDTRQLYDSSSLEVATIRSSSYNSQSMPTDLKLATYNFMALAMDYFYGIKKFAEIETYYNELYPYIDNMVYGNDDAFYRSIFEFIYGLDDLHSSHVFTGFYEPTTFGYTLRLEDLGTRVQSYYNRMWSIQDQYEAKFGTAIPIVRMTEDQKTAIIYIEGFDVKTPDLFKASLDQLPETVENVVLDIANNGGGNLGAVLRIFGYMVEEDIVYHSQNPADGSAVTYYIQSEYAAYNYNWFIMTSSVTFSAANLMASIGRELGIPIIGQNSSGGASSIGIILPPGGSSLLISTNNVLSARIFDENENPVYLSIEYGIKVDYRITSVTNNEEVGQMVNYINSQRILQ